MALRKTKKRGQVPKSKAGRICKKTGCSKRLSVYNSGEYCHSHKREFLK